MRTKNNAQSKSFSKPRFAHLHGQLPVVLVRLADRGGAAINRRELPREHFVVYLEPKNGIAWHTE